MARVLNVEDIPELPGYSTVAAVSERYGVVKGTIYHMLFEQGKFKHVYKIRKGGNGGETKPLLMLLDAEVERVFADRSKLPVNDPELSRRRTEWSKRVKNWGREVNWTQTPIAVSGPPPAVLVAAYVQANPRDPRPESE